MSNSPSIATQCPHCQGRFRAKRQLMGRTAQCPKCGQAFDVREARASAATEDREPAAERPSLVGVNCRLCGTRMYAQLSQVGKHLTCPDCATKTLVPPPPPPPAAKTPAAMLGEQYELYEGDEQPWGVTLAMAQAKLVPVRCELCDTLSYAEPQRVGTQLECADCGHRTLVRPVADRATTRRKQEPELELEPARVTEGTVTPTAAPLYSRLHDFEALSTEDREKAISRVSTNRRARPKMPRWPLLSGWGAFIAAPGIIARWLVLSAWLPVAVSMMAGAAYLTLFVEYGALSGLPLLCAAATVCSLWLGAASAIAMTIVTESSEGNDQVSSWPSINPTDWLVETGYLAVAFAASAAPGYIVASLAGAGPAMLPLAMLTSGWLFFPVMHLSALEASAPFALLMPGVVGSVRQFPGSWVLCYLISAGLFAAVVGALIALLRVGPVWGLLAAPLAVAALGLYFRLLGRLAWRLRHEEQA